MPFTLIVTNKSTGVTAELVEGGSTGTIDVKAGDSIEYGGIGGNPSKKVDLQKSPDGSSWTTWQSIMADFDGGFSFLTETMPTPVPTATYRRAVSRTV